MRAYNSDYAGLAERNALAGYEGRWPETDRGTHAGEVESSGKHERQCIVSRLTVLLLQLLKQRCQPMKASRSWQLTIEEQRRRTDELLAENPDLRSQQREFVDQAYQRARFCAIRETGLEVFPEECPFVEAEIWGDRP